jgi:hypothetical protein
MSNYIETRWTFDVDGRQVNCSRTASTRMKRETYILDEGENSVGLVFTDKHLPALRAFLAAMDAGPGARVVRCKHCDEELFWSTCSMNGVEVPDTYDGPWVNEMGTSRCEESPNGNEAWSSAHEPDNEEAS